MSEDRAFSRPYSSRVMLISMRNPSKFMKPFLQIAAMMLCILAALFAVEAKVSLYHQQFHLVGNIGSAKALPARVPNVQTQANAPVSTAYPTGILLVGFSFLLAAPLLLGTPIAFRNGTLWPSVVLPLPIGIASSFYFFRPPPAPLQIL